MSDEIKIDKNVPMPPWNLHSSSTRFPFDKLKVGESFAVDAKHRSVVRTQMWFQHRKTKNKFASRLRDGEIRVWRIK